MRYVVTEQIAEWLKYGPWLGAPRQSRFFTEPRLIVRQIASGNPARIFAGFTSKPLYHTQIGFAILAPTNPLVPLKVLLALLNSQLINYYHEHRFLDREKVLFQKVLIANVRKFPVPIPDKQSDSAITALVDQVLAKKRLNSNADTTDLEHEIDQHVYALYGLTPEEIAIVEGSTK